MSTKAFGEYIHLFIQTKFIILTTNSYYPCFYTFSTPDLP